MHNDLFQDPTSVRKQLAADRHRPGYHFLPPKYWMNDPNGIIQWGGKYHLFYQYNPHGPLWGSIHWGHASSDDLIHWKDHPLALNPDQGTGDENGCWSGCIVVDQGLPTAVYTGFVEPADTPVMLATSSDPDLIHWRKHAQNPVIDRKPPGVRETDFRDPYVWREDGVWKMVIGAGLIDGHCAVLLYQSEDLIAWDYLGILYQSQVSPGITTWECPSFFPLGNKFVLLVSLCPSFQGVYYYVGDYDGRTFIPQGEGYLESGATFYAPQVRQINDGRMLMFAWLLEGRADSAITTAGWAGVQTLPSVLVVDEDLQVLSQPVEELKSLRGEVCPLTNLDLPADTRFELPLRGTQLEIELVIDHHLGKVGLCFLSTDDDREVTCAGYDPGQQVVYLDIENSSLDDTVLKKRHADRLAIDPDMPLKIHAFIDRSVIEIWFNDRIRISGRVYPTSEKADSVKLFTQGGAAHVRSLIIWEMQGIWPEIHRILDSPA